MGTVSGDRLPLEDLVQMASTKGDLSFAKGRVKQAVTGKFVNDAVISEELGRDATVLAKQLDRVNQEKEITPATLRAVKHIGQMQRIFSILNEKKSDILENTEFLNRTQDYNDIQELPLQYKGALIKIKDDLSSQIDKLDFEKASPSEIKLLADVYSALNVACDGLPETGEKEEMKKQMDGLKQKIEKLKPLLDKPSFSNLETAQKLLGVCLAFEAAGVDHPNIQTIKKAAPDNINGFLDEKVSVLENADHSAPEKAKELLGRCQELKASVIDNPKLVARIEVLENSANETIKNDLEQKTLDLLKNAREYRSFDNYLSLGDQRKLKNLEEAIENDLKGIQKKSFLKKLLNTESEKPTLEKAGDNCGMILLLVIKGMIKEDAMIMKDAPIIEGVSEGLNIDNGNVYVVSGDKMKIVELEISQRERSDAERDKFKNRKIEFETALKTFISAYESFRT